MINLKPIFLPLVLSFLLTAPLQAQYNETIRSGRPGISIGPFTAGKDVFQIQTGLTYGATQAGEETAENAKFLAESTVIRFGLTRTLEVSTAFTFSRDETENDQIQRGLSQADVGFRVDLYEGQGLVPTVGFQSRFKLNVLSKDYNPDHLGIVCLFVTSQNFTPALSLTTNWGAVWNGDDPDPGGIYAINLSFPIAGQLSGFVENYGSVSNSNFDTNFDGGVAYLLNNDLQLDLSGGYGKNDGISNYFVDAGLSWRFIVNGK